MPFEILYSAEAVAQLRKLRAFHRNRILDQIEQSLRVNPTLVSKARVKLLRQPAPTQYRLKVEEHRVFYDVEQQKVNILQVLSKEDAITYLREWP